MRRIRTLVTGAGSGVGQAILKSLGASKLPLTIISADIDAMNAGLYFGHESFLIPRVEERGSLDKIIKLFKTHSIQVVLIGSEFEVEFFARHKEAIEKKAKVIIAVSPLETVQIAGDKYLTMEFLKKNDLPFAEAFFPVTLQEAREKAECWGYPVLLKPRTGTSSRGVHFLRSEKDLSHWFEPQKGMMLQRMLDKPSSRLANEYTCSIFKCRDGSLVGPFTARRTLRGGHSWIVEVKEFKPLHPLLLAIGKKLPSCGSLNIQLIVSPQGPVPFEFNARFSGTTAVRAYFGFNEPEMFIRNYFLKEKIKKPVIRNGLALHYPEEVFLEGKAASTLKEPLPKGRIARWF